MIISILQTGKQGLRVEGLAQGHRARKSRYVSTLQPSLYCPSYDRPLFGVVMLSYDYSSNPQLPQGQSSGSYEAFTELCSNFIQEGRSV